MKLTKGKISKLYNKKKQTLKRKVNKGKKSSRGKTFRRKQKMNLARKSLKRLRYKKQSGGKEDPKEVDNQMTGIEPVNVNKTESDLLPVESNPAVVETPNVAPVVEEPVVIDPVTQESIATPDNELNTSQIMDADVNPELNSSQMDTSQMMDPEVNPDLNASQMMDPEVNPDVNDSQMMDPDENPDLNASQMMDPEVNPDVNDSQMMVPDENPDLNASQMMDPEVNPDVNDSQIMDTDENPDLNASQMMDPEVNPDVYDSQIMDTDENQDLNASQMMETEPEVSETGIEPNMDTSSDVSSSDIAIKDDKEKLKEAIGTIVDYLAVKVADEVAEKEAISANQPVLQDGFQAVSNAALNQAASVGGKKRRTRRHKFRLTKNKKTRKFAMSSAFE
jgi:hypothetical protein